MTNDKKPSKLGSLLHAALNAVLEHWIIALLSVLILSALAFVVFYAADADARAAQWFAQMFWVRTLFPNGWNLLMAGPLAFVIGAAGFYALYRALRPEPRHTESYIDERGLYQVRIVEAVDPLKRHMVRIAALVAAIATFAYMFLAIIVNVPAKGASYNSATTLVVEDLTKLPPTLANVRNLHKLNDPACDLVAVNNGNRTCVKQGKIDNQWVNRNVSVEGAKTVLSRNASNDNNADLLEDTLSLVRKGDTTAWSGVMDGKNAVPIKGVSEWSGKYGELPNTCTFHGDFELNKAFNGAWGTNLADDVAAHYPGLLYDLSDMWGYCKGTDSTTAEPIIVIPMTKQVGTGRSYMATRRFAGLLTIQGSPSGRPKYSFDATPKAESYPGPIYPASLAAQQRKALDMQAGLIANWTKGFGYQTISIAANADNPSEYQLVSAKDGRNYWVTPLSPRGSRTQNVIAYAVVPADSAKAGELNPLMTYVLNGDVHDSRIANLQTMVQNVTSAVNREESNFTTSGGSIKEFLPVTGNMWQVYAERGGLVKYKIDVKTDGTIVSVEALERENANTSQGSASNPAGPAPAPAPAVSGVACGKSVQDMSNAELTDCIKAAADEAGRRMNTK